MRLSNKKSFYMFIILFIVFDQSIKLVIWNYFMEVYKYPIINGLLFFAPIINKDLTYVHALFNLPVNTIFIIAMNILIVIFFFSIYRYTIYKIRNKNTLPITACLLGMSGSICALLDKLFWGGSLDYIYIEHLFICDLKDIFLFLTMILTLFFVLTNQNTVKNIKIKDFTLFCLGRKV